MSRLAAGVLIGVLVVAVSVFVAGEVDVSQAGEIGEGLVSPEGDVPLSGTAAGGGKSFIGIVISTLSPEEATERGLESGVLVGEVQDGGPADGKLLEDDVIVAIGAEETAATEDVIRIVQASAPGDTLIITVLRGTETVDVAVEVGTREVRSFRMAERLHGLAPGLSGFGLLPGAFVRAEIVVEVDGVFQTLRLVRGTVESVDVEAGTFVLAPGDGSESISYAISADTSVNLVRKGDLGGLEVGEEAMVVDVDGDVKLVSQGDGLHAPLLDGGLLHGLLPGLSGQGMGLHGLPRSLAPLQGLGGRFQMTDRFDFKGSEADVEAILRRLEGILPEAILDRLEEFRLTE